MNKDSTGSDYRPRATRTRKNKTTLMILLAAAALLIIISGILYSVFTAPTGSGQKQTAAGNDPAANESAENNTSSQNETTGNEPAQNDSSGNDTLTGDVPAENNASSNSEPDGNQESGNSDTSGTTPDPGEVPADNAGTEKPAEAGQGAPAVPDDSQEEIPAGKPVNSGGKDTAPSVPETKLPATYVVRKGDTLSTISMKFYHSKQHVDLLAEHNHIVFINDMKVGDTIKIPSLSSDAGSTPGKEQDIDYTKVTLPVTYMVRAGDTLYKISMLFYQSKDYVDLIAKNNKLEKTEELKAGSSLIIPALAVKTPTGADNSKDEAAKEHIVQKGDTLSNIARKYYGSDKYIKLIAEYNQLADNDDVKVGDVLKIPPAPTP